MKKKISYNMFTMTGTWIGLFIGLITGLTKLAMSSDIYYTFFGFPVLCKLATDTCFSSINNFYISLVIWTFLGYGLNLIGRFIKSKW